MPSNRFFFDISLKNRVVLEGNECRHLLQVMRNKRGDIIELINGKGILAEAKILKNSQSQVVVDIINVKTLAPLLPPLILIQAIPKRSILDFIIQKGTELGVSKFYLYPSQRSEKKTLSKNHLNRLHHILVASIKQCGRLHLPTIEMGFPKLDIPLFFGSLSKTAPLLITKKRLPAALVIGPESGFTDQENEELEKKGVGVRLGPYVLRTETAALSGLSILANS